MLGIVYRTLATSLIIKACFSYKTAKTCAVTLIQRFGSALNLNIYLHILFLDGVFIRNVPEKTIFVRTKAPTLEKLNKLVHSISHRVARCLERKGLLVRDEENTYLQLDILDDIPMQDLQEHSISYRIALGHNRAAKRLPFKALLGFSGRTSETFFTFYPVSQNCGLASFSRPPHNRYIPPRAIQKNQLPETRHHRLSLHALR